jgi:hypothetical protein
MTNTGTYLQAATTGKVLVIDTEQGRSYGARTMKLILKIAGLERSNNLIYSDMRELSPADRFKCIEAALEGIPCIKLVIIDGLVDLLTDFMEAAQGHSAVLKLLKLCSKYNVHIAVVLHENKNDKNARAHVGTIATQKCEMQIATEVDPHDRYQSIVTCVNSRGLPFEPFAIRWDKGCLPRINNGWDESLAAERKSNRKYEQAKEMTETLFKPLTALSYNEAVEAVMQETGKSESTAKRIIKDLLGWKLINKSDDGLYRINKGHEGSKRGS